MSDNIRMAATGFSGETALLAMDLQRDFLQSNGRLPIEQAQTGCLIATMNAALSRAARSGMTIIYLANAFSRVDPLNLTRNFAALRGSPGAELDPRIVVVPQALHVQKKTPNAFGNPLLRRLLAERGVNRLVVGGVYADGCVLATCRAAMALGFDINLLGDGIGARSERARAGAVRKLVGRGAKLVGVEDGWIRR